MVKVVGVKFRGAGKVYYFSPAGLTDLKEGTGVIVKTARGLEFGTIAMEETMLKDSALVDKLKDVVRVATEADLRKREENEAKKDQAMTTCRELIRKNRLDMRLIDVDFTFDNNKIVFYFSSDGRVDFRNLVKDLATVFHMRIELRQIGVRDEAKMLGGCGPCGRPLCCASWMHDFRPVSIKMAKNQNLSLNPTKISGICGRLVCCLAYENDVYADLRRDLPATGEKVRTPDGMGRVASVDVLGCKVSVRLYSETAGEEGKEPAEAEIKTYKACELERLASREKTRIPDKRDQEREAEADDLSADKEWEEADPETWTNLLEE